MAYHRKDVVGLAKLLTEISKSNPNFAFKAALVEGKVVPASEIQAIASMPSREVMLSKLVFLLKAPLQRLAYGSESSGTKFGPGFETDSKVGSPDEFGNSSLPIL